MKHKIININNFETYVIDYFDGKLSEEQQRALFVFLETYPSLMADFELFGQSEDAVIKSDTITFPDPEKLKKNVIFSVNDLDEFNYKERFIAFYEGDLNESDRQTLSVFLEKNSFLLSEFESFGNLRLVPDKNVIFKDKQRLKHTTFRFSSAMWIVGASVAAVLLLFFLFRPNTEIPFSPITSAPTVAQPDDNEPKTITDTTTNPLSPSDNIIPQKEHAPKSPPVLQIAHTEEITTPPDKSDTKPALEILPAEQNTEIATSERNEIVRVLEPDVVLIKTISETDPATEEFLSAYQEQQQKRPFFKILSWGVRQYNYITNDNIAVMKVENLTTNETVYYLCRGE